LVRQGDWHLVLLVAPPHRSRRLGLLAQVLQRNFQWFFAPKPS
jgi:hypothetical protein